MPEVWNGTFSADRFNDAVKIGERSTQRVVREQFRPSQQGGIRAEVIRYDLTTGAPVGDAEEGLKSYPLKAEGDDLYVALGR